jgi:hypothetical protein
MKEREEIEREKSEKEKRNENTKMEKQKPVTSRDTPVEGETKAETPLNKRMHSRSAGGRDETIKEGERKRGPRSERMRGKRREEATDTRGKDKDRERKKP